MELFIQMVVTLEAFSADCILKAFIFILKIIFSFKDFF